MKLFSQLSKGSKHTVRILCCIIAICLVAFDYSMIVYARDPVSFTSTYSRQSVYFNQLSSVTVQQVYPAFIKLSYDDLVEYLGTPSLGDTLTFTVNSVSGLSYKVNNSSKTTYTVNSTSPTTVQISATPAGGGDAATTQASFGEQVTISYGGGDIEISAYPVYLVAQVPGYEIVNVTVTSTWSFSFAASPRSDNEALNDLVDNQEKFRQEDREDAEQAGTDAGNLVEEMQTLKEKWEILWYPIEFTNQLLSVFTGGSAARAYTAKYYNVTGYTYDEETGMLVPVRNPIMTLADAQATSGGATITFPEYTLPVLNVKLWDSYTFDLTTIKDSFPVLFDAIYVVTTVLEMYWFVGFLRSKFEEVFG